MRLTNGMNAIEFSCHFVNSLCFLIGQFMFEAREFPAFRLGVWHANRDGCTKLLVVCIQTQQPIAAFFVIVGIEKKHDRVGLLRVVSKKYGIDESFEINAVGMLWKARPERSGLNNLSSILVTFR